MKKKKRILLPLLALTALGGLCGRAVNVNKGVAGAIKTADVTRGGIKRAYDNTMNYNLELTESNFKYHQTDPASGYYDPDTSWAYYVYDNATSSYSWHSKGDLGTLMTAGIDLAKKENPNSLAFAFYFPATHTAMNADQSDTYDRAEQFPSAKDATTSSHVHTTSAGLSFYVFSKAELADVSEIQKELGTSSFIETNPATTSDCYYFGFRIAPIAVPDNVIVSGGVKHLSYYIPNVPTLDSILSGVSGKDLFGIDCTVNCSETERVKYTGKLGSYDIQVTATDSYGQSATATLNINILDNVKPVIKQINGKSLTYTAEVDSLVSAELPSFFNITDNGTEYGGTIGNVTYKYDGQTVPDKAFTDNDIGIHKINVSVSDSSGNAATSDFTLTVVDGTAPVITKADGSAIDKAIKFGVTESFRIDKSGFVKFFSAKDNHDGNLTSKIKVEGNFLDHKVGRYPIILTCTDNSGNKGNVTTYIEVVQDLPPVFILSDDLVQATINDKLSVADLTSVVTDGILNDKDVLTCAVDCTAYLGNEEVVGEYPITYQAEINEIDGTTSKQGTFTLRIINPNAEENEENAWYTPLSEFFQKLGNWFRGIFTKFKFNCFITNEEWNTRFSD